MSQCSQPTSEFIKSTFGPKIAVVGSDEVRKLCLNDGLTLVELLKPFSKLNTEFQIRDPTNTPHVIKGLHLSFGDPFKPGESSQVFRKLINDDISSNYIPGNMALTVKGYQVKQSCPWYEVFRDLYFQCFQSQEHDSIMHNLACIIFVAAHEDDPAAQFQSLTEEVMKAPVHWVDSDMMCYHVLVQDMSWKPKTPADQTMQSLSTMYGPATCHLLNLHERKETESEPPGPNPWRQFAKDRSLHYGGDTENKANLTLLQMAMDDNSDGEVDPLGANSPDIGANLGPNPMLSEQQKGKQCGENLTIADQSAIRVCINDFVVRGLLPFNERRMRALNEALNTRRGLRGTLFSATKKLFSAGPKPGVAGKVPANPGYLTDSPEILLRRLGDISFLLQHYTMAYTSYHQVKRDFQNDQAYNHYAAALEMTSLSLFMGSGVRREPHPYYDECINVYLNLCKAPLYAMRATLVHCECLISRGYYLSAASWFIKMTNDEADLNSGLLLEQGAHCYVRMDPPSLRKYAFHLVLAGHRYSKAGQRKHALRCYKNAWDIFKGKGWSLAENHIGFTIGRLSYNIRDIDGAYDAYQSLLTYDEKSVHVMHSQILFQKGIQDFVSVVQIYLQSQAPGSTVELPIPIVDNNYIHVSLFGEQHAGVVKETPDFDKAKRRGEVELEERAHNLITEGRISFFKPSQTVFSGETLNTFRPICAINETVTVLIPLKNPLQVPLTLSNISLHCLHSPRDPNHPIKQIKTPSRGSSPDLSYKNKQKTASKDQVETSELARLVLGPEEDVIISLSVTPLVEGNLTISSLIYHLVSTKAVDKQGTDGNKESVMENMIPGKINLHPRGPRLNNTKDQRVGQVYGVDNRLNLLVTSPLPKVELKTSALPSHLFCGEVKCAVIEATNTGATPLTNLCLVTSRPCSLGEVRLSPFQPVVHPRGGQYCHVINPAYKDPPAALVDLPDGQLNPGQTAYIAVWVYGGEEAKTYDLVTLLYFTPSSDIPGVTHRAVSTETKVNVSVSVTVESQVCNITPTSQNKLHLLGSVVVNNVGYYSLSLQDLHVTQLSLVSDRWILQSLESNIPLVVYPGASINIPFRAELAPKESAYFSSVSLGSGPLVDTSANHVLDLYKRSQACCEVNKKCTDNSSPNFNMGMLVFWEGSVSEEGNKSRVLHAQHHTALQASLVPLPDQLLSLGLSYKESWTADFKTCPLLPVPVTLHITNCFNSSLTVMVTANTTAGRPTAPKDTLPFMWRGMVRHKIEIPDHVTRSVNLTAVFSTPGVYNINQFSVSVVRNSGLLPQVIDSTSLLRVDAL